MSIASKDKIEEKKSQLKKLKLTEEEYKKIIELIGREPNEVELHMFSVMWSEHCCYKNSKPLLKNLPTKNKYVLVGPGENAGVVSFGEGLRIAFKIESHNRPTAVEPFQGATTGVGGILRDIFTMGARPIAVLDSIRFGDLSIARSGYLFNGAVSGISHYGNCTGIPNIGGETYFYPTYNENPLVNAMAIGLIETDEIVKSGASGIGNSVIYVGSKTGKDGIGGASFASSGLTDKSHQDRPAVQVGDPFTEKILIEACLEAFKTDYVIAAQDMGAAGLTCSTCEMAAKGNVGIEIDLDKVPIRTQNLTPTEYMISESQERMLFVVRKGCDEEIKKIFDKWDLDSVKIGEITSGDRVKVKFKGETVVDLPAKALVDDTPLYIRESKEPEYYLKNKKIDLSLEPDLKIEEIPEILKSLLSSPNIASKKMVYSKYDHQVQTNTVIKPGSTAGLIRLKDVSGKLTKKGLAVSCDGNSMYVYLDPKEGSKIAVAEAARNISCTGATPIAITDNLNFGNPEKPEIYWQLKESIDGIREACLEFDTPVTGGNVSLYNESNKVDIWPTPVIGMVGYLEDVENAVNHSFKNSDDLIIMLGRQENKTYISEYSYQKTGKAQGAVPKVDLNLEKKVQQTVRELIKMKLINSANDVSVGGLLVALCKCGFENNLGFILENYGEGRVDNLLFGEAQGRIIISINNTNLNKVKEILDILNCPYLILGKVIKDEAQIANLKLNMFELKTAWGDGLKKFFN